MEERVSGKASKSLYPPLQCSLHSASGEIIMDGASTFFNSEMYAWLNICSNRKQMFCGIIYSSLSIRNAYCFSQKNICNQSENISEYISMLQKYKNNSLSVRKIFPVPENIHFEGTLESFWTKPHLEVKIVYV